MKRCVLILTLFMLGRTALAAEGGTGHYAPGSLATLIDLPPTQEGWVVEPMFINYQGDTSLEVPVAGVDTFALDVESDVFLLGGFYTFALSEDTFYSFGGFLPYASVEAKATVQSAGGSMARRDKASGLGDISLIPAMIAMKKDFWQYSALLSVYAPTGDYETGRLANPGLNYWTVDPAVGVSYNNDKTGFNAALYGGVAFNTENTDTDYQSGNLLHIEASIQQLLPLGKGVLGVGAEAFYLDQITGDSGSGAILGDFERKSTGIGPVLSYILPLSDGTLVSELRWLPESDVERQLEGDYLWLKVVYQY